MKRLSSIITGAAVLVVSAAHGQALVHPQSMAKSPPPVPGMTQPDAQTGFSMRPFQRQDVVETPVPGVHGSCSPGHCTHRTAFSRRRCKRHLQELFLGFPEEFERPPLGMLMHSANRVAVNNGEAASMIFRQYDFNQGTDRLNIPGNDKLREIATKLPTSFAPVIVERSRNPALDESRRIAILAALGKGSFPIPPDRVVIAPSISKGLSGEEALIIDGTELTRTELTGPPIGLGVTPSTPASVR